MGTQSSQREKRRFERVHARNLVSFAHLTPRPHPGPIDGLGRTLDVGAGGARLETDRPLVIGERLDLAIALGSTIVHAEATVVHVATSDSAMVQAGLAFDRIPAPDRESLLALAS